jgi:uncharacterized linocin/CFP29 family protein
MENELNVNSPAEVGNADILGFSQMNDLFVNGKLNINKFRTNSVLRKDEWELLDTRIVDIAKHRLVAVGDVRAAGLVHNLGSFGVSISQYEKLSDMTEANVDMDGGTAGEEDRVAYELVSIPVPIIHKNFRIGLRTLEASRRLGQSLDTTQAEKAARLVADQLEYILFYGASGVVVNGQQLYGLTNQPHVNTVSGADWGTITNIYSNVNSAVIANEADNYFGPYALYVAKTQFGEMRAIYTDGSGETALERVLRGFAGTITSIKPADTLSAGTAVLVQLTRDVVDLAVGVDVSTVQWETRGGFFQHFKIFGAMAPRVKSDYDGKSGVCVITGI